MNLYICVLNATGFIITDSCLHPYQETRKFSKALGRCLHLAVQIGEVAGGVTVRATNIFRVFCVSVLKQALTC